MVAAVFARPKTSTAEDSNLRPPLGPSERDNAAPKKPKGREITSRYLSSLPSTPTAAGAGATSRRCPSPVAGRPAASTDPFVTPKRSQSAERRRPATPSGRPSTPAADPVKRTPESLWPSTRSLSVSFQGESFSLPVGRKERPPATVAGRGTAVRKAGTTPEKKRAENAKPVMENNAYRARVEQTHRWPGIASGKNALSRSLDFTDRFGRDATARVLQQASGDEFRRSSTTDTRMNSDSGGTAETSENLDLASDSESVSSSSNSVTGGANSRHGVFVQARFLQETGSRLRRQSSWEPHTPLSGDRPKSSYSKFDSPVSSPRTVAAPSRTLSSPTRNRPASPSRYGVPGSLSSKGTSPMRSRMSSTGQLSNSNSTVTSSRTSDAGSLMLNLADVRKSKKGANHVEDAHTLKLLHNRNLQWRFVNARADNTLATQCANAERALYSAWIKTSSLEDSVMCRRIKLQQLRQHMKLSRILHGQMSYLEEWSMMDRDHACSLTGAIEALKASTLRLPIIGGAKADIQDVKEAISSAVDVMQTMGPSICHLLSKLEGMNNSVSKIADLSAQERAVLDNCTRLLSTVAALQVEECSLRTHLLQIDRDNKASDNSR